MWYNVLGVDDGHVSQVFINEDDLKSYIDTRIESKGDNIMYKTLVMIFCFLFVILFICYCINCFYLQILTVTEIDYINDVVYIKTSEGFMYSFKGASDWIIGDKIAAIMFNKFSQDIKDDLIIKVKYCR